MPVSVSFGTVEYLKNDVIAVPFSLTGTVYVIENGLPVPMKKRNSASDHYEPAKEDDEVEIAVIEDFDRIEPLRVSDFAVRFLTRESDLECVENSVENNDISEITDLDEKTIKGVELVNDVYIIESYINSEIVKDGADYYTLFLRPEPEKRGIILIDSITRNRRIVDAHDPIEDEPKNTSERLVVESVNSPIACIKYNTIEPRIIASEADPVISSGTRSVYLDLNIEVLNLSQESFIIEGVNVGPPNIYAAISDIDLPVGTRPSASQYKIYSNTSVPRRYFRLDFEFPNPPPLGNMSIDLAEGAVRGAL